jgi:peptidoglycan/xylan/chitin deacetylase (PgdA/CDA1 family)
MNAARRPDSLVGHLLRPRRRPAPRRRVTLRPVLLEVRDCPATNLIANASAETSASGSAPDGWTQDHWGTNTVAFSYPTPGLDGQRALRVDMTAQSSGDAKWYFADVPVTPGQQYTFSDLYQSNVLTSATIRYTKTDGKFSYVGYYPANAATTASPFSFNFTAPAGVVSATVFHLIQTPGYLVTDAYSLTPVGSADTTPPTVSVTAPAAGATVTGTINLKANAADNVAVAGVKFFIDGVQVGAEDTAAPYQRSVNTGTLTAGTHTLTAVARDTAGLTTTSAPVTFTVGTVADTTAPTVSVTAPAANANVSGTINLTANASDNVGVVGVKFLVDGTLVGSEDTTAPYSVSLNTATLTAGSHTVTAVARDAAGNTTTSAGVAFTVVLATDTTAPTVSVTAPAANANVTGTINLTANATDNVGVVGVQLLVDGVLVGAEDTAAPYSVSLDTTTLTAGNHTVTAIARDAAGNTKTSAGVTFNVALPDTTAPTVSVTSPADTASVSGTINLTATAADNVGVAGVKFFLDGTQIGNEDAAAPYQMSFDTGTLAVGSTHTVTAVARDAAGNSTTSTGVTFTVVAPVDTTAPTVSVTAPTNNASVTGTINLTANGSDNVGVVGVQFLVDGNLVGAEDTTAPYSVSLDTTTLTAGNHTVTAVARDAAGNTNTSAGVTFNVVLPDTTAPTVSVTAPAAGGSVSGSTSLTATATDNVGVAGVKLLVDGVQVGAEDTTAPYSVSLDTTTLANGDHTVTAVARDAAGNLTTSAGVTFTVANTTTTPINLIQNPSLENLGASGDPVGWTRNGWGTNTAAYSVVAGVDGARAVRVDMTAYTSGDAKWVFADVPVSANTIYTFSDAYRSNASSQLVIQYTLSDGSFSYVWVADLGAAANWTNTSYQVTTPANAVSMTVFHLIHSVGWLETDKFALTAGPTGGGGTPGHGMISLTFDDGWLSQLQTAVPILEQANLPASFYIITRANQGGASWEEVLNPSLETAGADGNPLDWNKRQTGTNTSVFTYTPGGSDGFKAARIDVQAYTSGESAWTFQDVMVQPGSQYTVSHQYNSNVSTSDYVRFTLHNGSVTFVDLGALPATNGNWNTQTVTVTAPANADAMTLVHRITRVGTLITDNYSVKQVDAFSNPDYMTPAQIQSLAAAGFEIGAHTMTHADLTAVSAAGALAEVAGAKADLVNLGLNPTTFAYPYGAYNSTIEQLVASQGFTAARTVNDGYNTATTDRFALMHHEVDLTTTVADVQGWINTATQTGTWLILTFHQVDTSGDFYSTTPSTFQQIVNLVKASSLTPVTTSGALTKL